SLVQAPSAGSKRSWPRPIWLLTGMRRDATPRQVWVHSCQLSMSSCSKVPLGLKPRTPDSRNASLTSRGAALSQNTQDHTSVRPGPRGCQTRNVREVPRNSEKFGNTVATIGLISPAREPSRLSTSGRISRSYAWISGSGASPYRSAPIQIITWPLPGDTMRLLTAGLAVDPTLNPASTAERWLQPTG